MNNSRLGRASRAVKRVLYHETPTSPSCTRRKTSVYQCRKFMHQELYAAWMVAHMDEEHATAVTVQEVFQRLRIWTRTVYEITSVRDVYETTL